jgi:hypothetical protein
MAESAFLNDSEELDKSEAYQSGLAEYFFRL